ncbi:MAG: diaminopimelate epimerase [Candidatus Gastranaerophilales bacterium]|nr:diaminopimelate epimerase [Candidatus Gastranaerophilales bacterium]MCM1072567.1 diaminopimelate epimerase [Bacteroides sp.]
MGIKFTKMQGCGNDFVIVDYEEFKKSGLQMDEAARKLCDRHFGVGADGLIIPDTNCDEADIGWFFYNSDGSTAQMCGNGMRCFAKYVYDKKLVDKKEFTVKTLAGIIKPQILDNGQVRVNMSKPILDTNEIPFLPNDNLNYKISVQDRIFVGNAVSMGNPHFVIFIKDNENLLELAKTYGPEIELGAEFPEKTNVEFIKIHSPKEIELCVWERGCGITLACGTGACASVVAGILNGLLENNVDVELLGGKVNVVWNGTPNKPQGDVFLSGPAEYMFNAEINI